LGVDGPQLGLAQGFVLRAAVRGFFQGTDGLDGLAIVFGEKLPVNIQKKMADFSRSSVPLPFAYLLGACLDFANVGTCIIKG
jgi:hypothetical protein